MSKLYKTARAFLLIVTIVPLFVMVLINSDFDGFMEDLWG